ncbi:hypothetical protein F0562_020219 [Nyssa sinensis]|uniref:Chloride channel protein n=1 Tax=Nyssa sinensis TaxID=561372 RepID=A0A5J5BR36_9ASTE|nr:hypothetical protein F0562_020219 [Nyssa sinensis]
MEERNGSDIEAEGLMSEKKELESNGSSFSDREISPIKEPLLKSRTNNTSQIAIVGANVCPIESLDYEIVENELLKQDWRSEKKVEIFKYVVLKWTLALLIGLSTGLVGFFSNIAVENIAGFKLLLTSNLMLKDRYYQAFAAYASCNMVLAIAAAALCAYIAPAAAGSGIPEVKAYLNGVDDHSILAPSTLFVKIFGSIFGVAAGFAVGKEGPMVHTGACIASFLGQGGSRKWRSALLWRSFFTTAVVAVVLRSLIEFCRSGKCGSFGQGGLIMFDVNSAEPTYNTPDILAVILLGIIGGIFGSLYNFLVVKVLHTYSIINERGPTFKTLLVITISLLTSCCSFGLPWLAKCTPCPVGLDHECPTIGRSGNFKNFQCKSGHYNDLSSLFLNTNDDAIRNLFSSGNEKEFHFSTLFIFFVAIFCLGIITSGIAIPSGLFIPVILAGASYGRLLGTFLRYMSNLDVGLFALLGAASFLGGTMRMTVSLCVMLLELTNNLLMLPLVMLVLLVSKTVGDSFNKGVYDQIVKMKGLPYMETHAEAEPYMKHLVARDVVSGPLITFSGVEKVGNIIHALKITRHNGFPVIDEPPFSDAPELCGLVLRSHLLVLLKGKKFTKKKVLTGTEILRRFHAGDFAKPGLGKGLKLDDLDMKDEEMEMYVDLHPITNTSPYTVVEMMSLAKAAVLFRQLGLRHLCVVPKTPGRPPIVGILTRHDFMPEHVLRLHPKIKPHK